MFRHIPVAHQVFGRHVGGVVVVAVLLAAFVTTAGASTSRDGQTDAPVCDAAVLLNLTSRADQGDTDAQFELGILLLFGHCVSEDQNAGLERLESAAEQDHAEAAYILGRLYSDDSHGLFDALQAHRYLRIAAVHGHVLAQHSLGVMLIRGDGGTDGTEAGLFWLRSAASEGYGLSALLIGRLHELGRFGVAKDLCEARDWYEAGLLMGAQDAEAHLERLDKGADCL